MFSRIAPTLRSLPRVARPLSTSATLRSGNHPLSPEPTTPPQNPPTTQGHASDKKVQKDVQSQYVQQGKDQREAGKSGGSGEDQPLDAARMDGGEAKPAEGKGPWKDQNGGQMGGEAGGGMMGEKTEAAGESNTAKVTKALGMKSSRKFSTSARAYLPASPGGTGNTIPGARTPKDTDVHGEQNEHLRHQSSGQDHADRKGNAADEPHLPSKGGNSGASKEGKRGLHTSARLGVKGDASYAGTLEGEAKKAGVDVPPEALPQGISSAYAPFEAAPAAPAGMTPSSEVQFSSSARDPPNDVLREKVKAGTMPEKNPQPNAEIGKKGIDDAWKDIKP